MNLSISQLRQSLISKVGGRSLTNIPNFYSIIQETCYRMMSNVDLPSSIRKIPLVAPIKESPNLYILPNDFSLNGLIDVYNRNYTQTTPRIRSSVFLNEFMRKVQQGSMAGLLVQENIDGVQYLDMGDSTYSEGETIDTCDNDNNGTWVASGTATNVRFDSTCIVGSSSVAFNVTATTDTFGVTKNNFVTEASATDQDYVTLWAYFPAYTTSVKIRYGIDSSNYKQITATTDWQGNRLGVGWHFMTFPIANATTTGTVGTDDVSYFAYLIDDDVSAQTGYRIDEILFSANYDYDLRYYSNSVITDQYGSRRIFNLPSADSDLLIINEREYILFLDQFSVVASVDIHPDSGANEYNAYLGDMTDKYERFRLENPSQRIILSSEY